MKKTEKAKSMFFDDYNCAQSVLITFANETGIDESTAKKIAFGFGAGMGRLQNTCGAITGAFMLLGLLYGRQSINDDEAKEKLVEAIQHLSRDFINIHGSLSCMDLLGCNISTSKGMDKANDANLFNTKCPNFIETVINLLEEKYLNR